MIDLVKAVPVLRSSVGHLSRVLYVIAGQSRKADKGDSMSYMLIRVFVKLHQSVPHVTIVVCYIIQTQAKYLSMIGEGAL